MLLKLRLVEWLKNHDTGENEVTWARLNEQYSIKELSDEARSDFMSPLRLAPWHKVSALL